MNSYKINNKQDIVNNVLNNFPQYHYEQKIYIFVMKTNSKCKIGDLGRPLEYFNDNQSDLKNINIDHLMKSFRSEFQRVTGTIQTINNVLCEEYFDDLHSCQIINHKTYKTYHVNYSDLYKTVCKNGTPHKYKSYHEQFVIDKLYRLFFDIEIPSDKTEIKFININKIINDIETMLKKVTNHNYGENLKIYYVQDSAHK